MDSFTKGIPASDLFIHVSNFFCIFRTSVKCIEVLSLYDIFHQTLWVFQKVLTYQNTFNQGHNVIWALNIENFVQHSMPKCIKICKIVVTYCTRAIIGRRHNSKIIFEAPKLSHKNNLKIEPQLENLGGGHYSRCTP